MTLETITREGASPDHRPALLFVHGGFHGAWCWDEHFLPWFAAEGWHAHALSLRGHAKNDDPSVPLNCSLSDYVDDVKSVLKTLHRPAVLIGHSMGGVVVQMCFNGAAANVAGAVLLASSPLRPAKSVVRRILLRRPIAFLRGQICGDMRATRTAMTSFFFDDALDTVTRRRYVSMLRAETSRGELFTRPPPQIDPSECRPVLVVAGRDDWSIPLKDNQWLRDVYQADFVVCPGAHDLMLSLHWEETARAIATWLKQRFDDGR